MRASSPTATDETGRVIRRRRAHAEDELATLGGDGFGQRPTTVGSRELEPTRRRP